MKSTIQNAAVSYVAVVLLSLVPVQVLAQKASSKPFVIQPSHHDISLPLRDLAGNVPASLPGTGQTIPLRPTRPLPQGRTPVGPDQVLQLETLPLVGTINGLNFDGVTGDPSGVAPPDENGAVGDSVTNQYVTIVNEVYAVYNKNTGATILGPTSIDAIWSGFSGLCSTGNGGDVNVLFDQAAARWVVAQLGPGFTSYCIAVSTSDDATGSYARYEFDFGNNVPDYPKLGVWPDAYYWASNTFAPSFIGAMPCAYDRASMLTGGPANAICFQQSSSVASLLPANLDGSTPPPAGEPNPYLELLDTSDLGLFKFHVDFTNPGNSTFTGPTAIPVASYSEACGGGTCIPQAGTTQLLDSLGDRLMFRNAYRNLNGTEYLVVNHSVTAGSSVGVRWYQITNPNGTPSVAQGTFAPDSAYRWMGSIEMDKAGDIAVGYTASSTSLHPAVRYTGRVPSDPAGTMESENSIIEGPGSQTGGLSRWGDYSGISIDPSDDCTFFYTNEYLPNNGSFNWNTRVGSFSFPSCTGAVTFSLSATPGSQSTVPGGSVTYTATATPFNGFSGAVSFAVTGCPTGATCTLNPTSVSLPPAGNSTLTVQTGSSTPQGSYVLTITATSGSITTSTSVTLTVSSFTIYPSPATQTVKKGSSTSYTATVTPQNGFNGVVTFNVSGLPASTTATFIPTSVTGSGSTVVTISTNNKTPSGTFTLSINGTSGGLTRSTMVTLKVSNNGK
jgi:hypothetical protein